MDRDLSRSRAILISNAIYRDPGIPDLAAASGCPIAMKALLTGDLCGWPAHRVECLEDVGAPDELATKLVELAEGVDDVLLLYYVGHGMRTATGKLALALTKSRAKPELLPHTAILYEAIAGILRGCPATTKLVILDCCHAELGNTANYQTQSADIDAEPVDGLYFIGASKKYEKARSPLSGGLPYFTDAFIEVVRAGIPGKPAQVTIDQVFVQLRARMLRANLPEPVQSGIRDAHHWPFARNAARPETHRDPDQEIAALLRRLAESEGLRAAADARIQSLQAEAAKHGAELERLQTRAAVTPDLTAQEKRELRSAIDSTERLLGDSVAAGAAAREAAGRAEAAAHRRSQSTFTAAVGQAVDGRYQLEGRVGRGSLAEVYRARDLRLDRVVAIKLPRADWVRNRAFQARFRREAQSASLNSPSIVAVYDTGEDMSTGVPVPFIVMEYVDGKTLRELLNDGHRLMPPRVLEITSGVLRALDYSHQLGIVHRGIRPGNVMVTRNGDVKVMDFGISGAIYDAASAATAKPTAQLIGTARYLTPEHARGGRVDARSDLYSTGCLMYELLVGRPPFTGDSVSAIMHQHARESPIPPSRLDPDLPPWADAIVLKALAKSASDRYQTAAEMNAAIQRAIAGRRAAPWPGAALTIQPAKGGRGLLGFSSKKPTPEPETTPVAETKVVRQPPVRQTRIKRRSVG
jgi:predicted Ser/Thr protein kinase